MTNNKIHFTKQALQELPVPEKRAVYHYDDSSRGLCVCVTPSNTKSFYVLRKFQGKTERILLGRFPETTIAQAKERGTKTHADMDAGINPNLKKRQKRDELTLNQLFEIYKTRHLVPHTKRPRKVEQDYERYLKKSLGNKRLSDIHKEDVATLHNKVGVNNGKGVANKMLTILKAMYNRAYEWDVWSNDNPTIGIKRYKEIKRERYLLPDELERFYASLRQEEDDSNSDFFLILLLTGVRCGNGLEMNWNNLNLESGIWNIPDTKNGEPLTIPLPDPVIAILKKRKLTRINEYVFHGTGKTGHLGEPKRAWKRILDRAEITDLRIHDLRHTFGSYMATGGANQFVIKDAMGHKDIASSARYVQMNIEPIREASNNTANTVLMGAENLIPKG